MPTNNLCQLNITGVGRGGKLTGPGFGPTPTLQKNDTLQVQVTWMVPTIAAPDVLNGHFVFSAKDEDQANGTPFLQPSGYVQCYDVQTGQQSQNNNQTVYTFKSYTYGGGLPGSYELTFVADAVPSGSSDLVQWSEDPEFETGG
jgi:hypothetical protein